MSRLGRSSEAGFVDRTTLGFITQLAQAAVYVIAAIRTRISSRRCVASARPC